MIRDALAVDHVPGEIDAAHDLIHMGTLTPPRIAAQCR